MKFTSKIIVALSVFAYSLIFAGPPGDIGPGAPPTSQIDMYAYGLLLVALSFIVYIVKSKKIQNKKV